MTSDNNNKIKIYCKKQMSTSYKIDKRIIRNVIKENIRVTNNNDKLDVIIYYESPKTAQLIMKNNKNKKAQLNTTNVIYQFTGPNDDYARDFLTDCRE